MALLLMVKERFMTNLINLLETIVEINMRISLIQVRIKEKAYASIYRID